MIIGNNNINNNTFNNKFKRVNEEHKLNKNKINPTQVDNKALYNADPTNKKEMEDKTFALLQDRLNKGTISLEEFNRRCSKLRRK